MWGCCVRFVFCLWFSGFLCIIECVDYVVVILYGGVVCVELFIYWYGAVLVLEYCMTLFCTDV